MYFRKFPHPANFEFVPAVATHTRVSLGARAYRCRYAHSAWGLCRVSVETRGWNRASQAHLTPPAPSAAAACAWKPTPGFGLALRDHRGHAVFSSFPGRAFGVCGQASLFAFLRDPTWRFYGLGEKVRGLEHSGTVTKFWNTDVLSDFDGPIPERGRPDPYYASIPYLIIQTGTHWVGLLLDNPHPTFIDTGALIDGREAIVIGSEDGRPDLYAIAATSLRDLTARLQRLVGVTPLPPAWALGYHQCRWGYRSARDLERLDRRFRAERIPCDGLWLDIDYMDGFRVFTFDRDHFPDPSATFRKLARRGRRVVPILDPGVKRERGNAVYEDGRRRDIFCRNPQGGEFTGLVWPGETVFPDFSLPEARAWWARHVASLARLGVSGAWIDMNDPSTGRVDPGAMLFNRGRAPHTSYHNQYALGMAMATQAGFAAARPGERPFLISRSGYVGIARHAALWTGDNFSNYHHLRNAIPTTLNLALSGVPFNGPDIGGFAGDTSPQLMRDWMKCCYLFPFCRNHSCAGTRDQEPWAFDRTTRDVLRHFVRLRYKWRPYLYQLYINQEETGAAILRPLFHDFPDAASLPQERLADQFLVGPAVLQAPLLDEKSRSRRVALPRGTRWYDARTGRWLRGGRTITVAPTERETPLYLRDGSIVPLTTGLPESAAWQPRRIEMHIFTSATGVSMAVGEYRFDDGQSLAYRNGARSVLLVTAERRGLSLEIRMAHTEQGFGKCRANIILHHPFKRVLLNGRAARLHRITWAPAGRTIPAWRVATAD